MLSVIMLNVAFVIFYYNAENRVFYCYAEYHYAETNYTKCRFEECRYAECRGAAHEGKLILSTSEKVSAVILIRTKLQV